MHSATGHTIRWRFATRVRAACRPLLLVGLAAGSAACATPRPDIELPRPRPPEAERAAPERRGFILHRPLGPSYTINREEGAWRVAGRSVERAVAFADLTMLEAADMAAKRLARMGVDEALTRAGAVAGDEVRIGDIAFEFTPDFSEEE